MARYAKAGDWERACRRIAEIYRTAGGKELPGLVSRHKGEFRLCLDLDKSFRRGSEKALELKAQKELEELRDFSAGRISLRFLLFYTLVCIFSIFAILFLVSVFFSGLVAAPEPAIIRDLVDMGRGVIGD